MVKGIIHGTIVWPPRGNKGFAYDPIMQPNGHERTFGEMERHEKSANSARGKAFALMIERCFQAAQI